MTLNRAPSKKSGAFPVVFLPGGILPGELRYARLIEILGDSVTPLVKELEVYAEFEPPANYSLELEASAVVRAAELAGFDRFHLYGHSAGGTIALAVAALYPQRLISLAVDEPTDFDSDLRNEFAVEMERIRHLPVEEQLGAVIAFELAAGVELPDDDDDAEPEPAWMSKRPAGIDAFDKAWQSSEISNEQLSSFGGPVYYSYGELSHPRYVEMDHRFSSIFSDYESECYAGLHHFNTSHAAQPERVATKLLELWDRHPEAHCAPRRGSERRSD